MEFVTIPFLSDSKLLEHGNHLAFYHSLGDMRRSSGLCRPFAPEMPLLRIFCTPCLSLWTHFFCQKLTAHALRVIL
jgi:hypothetical protein